MVQLSKAAVLIGASLVVAQILLLSQEVEGARVTCNVPNRWCDGLQLPCPRACSAKCRVNCGNCRTSCNIARCNRPGSVCQDPRFIGGDGVMFYFHGKRDRDFCIVSDPELHINAHFIGKQKKGPGLRRDFTWVQSLGILFGKHKLYVGAKKVALWDDAVDQLELKLDGAPITLPSGGSAVWEEPLSGLRIERLNPTNDISVEVADAFSLKASVRPVTQAESKIHNYDISSEDCFAHLDMSFQFHKLSAGVHGVLGQTYAPEYESRVNATAAMPIMGGDKNFLTSGLLDADCAVSRFGAALALEPSDAKFAFHATKCGSDTNGFTCRR